MLNRQILDPCGAFTQLTELTREACPGIQLEDGLAKEARDRGRQRWSATRCVADVSVALMAGPSRKQPPPHTSSNGLSQPSADSEVVRIAVELAAAAGSAALALDAFMYSAATA